MRLTYKYLKQAGLLLATFLSATALLAPVAMAVSPGSVNAWKTNANPLPQELYSAGSVTYNGYVYVMGGTDDASNPNPNTYYAKLNSNGTIGSWKTSTNAIPYSLMGTGTVTYNGYVYLLGGDFSGTNFNKVFYARLNSDGSVGTWNTSTNVLPQATGWPAAVTYNGYVYVMGGYGNAAGSPPMPVMYDTVYYAKLNSDGSVGTWNTSTNVLPSEVGSAASVIQNGYVYVIGGSDSNFIAQPTVYYAKLNSDGSVGTWNTSTNVLPSGMTWSTAATLDNYVYIMGGRDSDNILQSTVYYAKLNSDGSVGTWNTSTNALPQAISHTSSVAANGHIYVMGGLNSDSVAQSTVYYTSLASDTTPIGTNTADTLPTAPDTGYGVPARSNIIVSAIVGGAVISAGAGLLVSHRQRVKC